LVNFYTRFSSIHLSFSDIDSLTILLFMTVPVARQPNLEPGLQNQTNIALNLFHTILDTARTRAKLNRSWATIERDISVQEQLEARRRQPRNQQ
jgi:hypothetical protein